MDTGFSSPTEFRENFMGYMEQIQRELERLHGDDAGDFPNVVERAQAEAPYVAARNWLVERWGGEYGCPVCGNIEWRVSEVGVSERPAGYFGFSVTCAYCGNCMQVVPGQAYLSEPTLPQQLQFPPTEQ